MAKDNRIERLKNKLAKIDYVIDAHSISVKDVSDYGVPQRRKRMILLASRFGVIGSPKVVKVKKTVFDAIGSLVKPGSSGGVIHDHSENRTEKIKNLIKHIPKKWW